MKNVLINVLLLTLSLALGFLGGWWANSPGYDMLCSRPSVYTLGKDIEANGINIKSGIEVDLRSCEYANRFTVNLYSEKGFNKELFVLKNSAVNIGNHGADQYEIVDVKQ